MELPICSPCVIYTNTAGIGTPGLQMPTTPNLLEEYGRSQSESTEHKVGHKQKNLLPESILRVCRRHYIHSQPAIYFFPQRPSLFVVPYTKFGANIGAITGSVLKQDQVIYPCLFAWICWPWPRISRRGSKFWDRLLALEIKARQV
jgi:hypothetical protein